MTSDLNYINYMQIQTFIRMLPFATLVYNLYFLVPSCAASHRELYDVVLFSGKERRFGFQNENGNKVGYLTYALNNFIRQLSCFLHIDITTRCMLVTNYAPT